MPRAAAAARFAALVAFALASSAAGLLRAAAPSPAAAGAPGPSVGSHPMFDLDGFVGDWQTEWRHGDFPRYTETHTDTWRYDDVPSKEDSQSDGKPSPALRGGDVGAYLPDELHLDWDKKPGPGDQMKPSA